MKQKKYQLSSVELNFIEQLITVERTSGIAYTDTYRVIKRTYNLTKKNAERISRTVRFMYKHCQNKDQDAMWIGYPMGWSYFF